MTTINLSNANDIIIPTNDGDTYRGIEGDDTYILVSQDTSSSVSIIDTKGNNTIQLPEWSKVKSIAVSKDAIRITCDDMTVFTINGADKFSYDIGGNITNNSIGSIKTFSEFVGFFDLIPPSEGTVSKSTNKIVYEDSFRVLYEVKVQKEDNGNKYYINDVLSPDLSLSSGEKYIFDLNDISASNHPLSISETKNGIHADGTSVTTGIKFYAEGYEKTESNFSSLFSPDSNLENAFMVFEPTAGDTALYYYCLFHSGMANDSQILIDGFIPIEAKLSVTNAGASDYTISNISDPKITLERGKTYEFDISAPGHPFWIKSSQINGTSESYNDGVTNNGASGGIITFTVPADAPSTLYYICQIHSSMTGVINIVDDATGLTIVNSVDTDSTASTPGYGGYDYGLILDTLGLEQIITPTFDI